ncbi:MAG: bifunctional DNA-formamidopyrimidine glycosylase/DNA-(apurinic or apyrimidinic site) lyase [Patescibacteria group bacterium]
MPELPEVETIRQQLAKKISDKKITKVEVFTPKIINISQNDFIKNTEGKLIRNIDRRAKILIIELSNRAYLLCHLKLSGHLIYHPKKDESHSKFAHVIFYLSNGSKLVFDDFRKFGYVKFVRNKNELKSLFAKEGFGPEPFDSDFTKEKFKTLLLKKQKSPIKTLLMDQKFIAGVGNVYAQEACFYAKINPQRKVKTLDDREIGDLYDGLKKIMRRAIAMRGNSVDSYLDAEGKQGKFQNYLKVYDREGQICFRCKTKIKKIWMAGRGTSFCPKCQR